MQVFTTSRISINNVEKDQIMNVDIDRNNIMIEFHDEAYLNPMYFDISSEKVKKSSEYREALRTIAKAILKITETDTSQR